MTRRTLLAFAAGIALLMPAIAIADNAGVGSWGMTGIAAVIMLLISLIDREWFYGIEPPDRR